MMGWFRRKLDDFFWKIELRRHDKWVKELPTDIREAHKKSTNHRGEILASEICGCFYCFAIFAPTHIIEWIDEDQTATCPECGIEAVIGLRSGYPITPDFLHEMHSYWFRVK